jgi:AraC family L-rhamnose operon transcriptional activator RhaR
MDEQIRKLGREVFAAAHVPINVNRHCIRGDVFTHDHEFMEIALVFGGTGAHRSIHGVQRLSRGDAIVLRPGSWHAYERCRALQVVNCCFGVELLRRELAWVLEDPVLNLLFWARPLSLESRGLVMLQLDAASLGRCRAHLDGMSGDWSSRAEQVGCLLMLLGELSRHIATTAQRRAAAEAARPVHVAVINGTRLLEEQYARAWTLDELAGELRIDPSYLARLFKRATGLPPMMYLARYRAERAASLLLRTNRPVSDIAAEVGWDDPNHFARRFRDHFGISASAYRARFQATSAP